MNILVYRITTYPDSNQATLEETILCDSDTYKKTFSNLFKEFLKKEIEEDQLISIDFPSVSNVAYTIEDIEKFDGTNYSKFGFSVLNNENERNFSVTDKETSFSGVLTEIGYRNL